MNCISCYKKHLALAYIHCCLYLSTKEQYHLIRITGQICNALEHARKLTKTQFNDSYNIYQQLMQNNFTITEQIAAEIYFAYYNYNDNY